MTEGSAPRRKLDIGGILITILTVICAVLWFFPVYWAIATSLQIGRAHV